MRSRIICCVVFCLLACNVVSVRAQDDPAAAWKPVDTALGRSGQMQPGDVYKFALPRRDMKVVKDGVTVAPGASAGLVACLQENGQRSDGDGGPRSDGGRN
jgi:hypothetical protein